MGLIDRLKRARELARLRRQVKRSPSPTAYGSLAERHIALGQTDEALLVAEQGLQLFPNSERLAQVRLFAKKKRLTGQIRKLREDMQRRPSPLVYSQLAEIYRELGSNDEALDIASECAEKFPLNENPYLIQGEIRLERFLRDVIAQDAILTENALKKVVRLNAHNVKAHTLLAELYYLVGADEECRKHLRSVLTIMPTAADVQSFVKELDTLSNPETEGLTFAELTRHVEDEGTFAHDAERFPTLHPNIRRAPSKQAGRVDVNALSAEVVRLGEEAGVRNTIIIDRDGGVIADHSEPGSLSRSQFAELVTSVREVADDASRRMDTGALVRSEIEGPAGNVTVARVRNLTIAIFYVDPLRPQRVWELLQDFIARNLTHSAEVAVHA